MSAPKNLFPGGSCVTSLPDMTVHQVISGPQRYNTERSCWEYDPTYNSKVTFENSSGVTFAGSAQPDFSKVTIYNGPWPEDTPQNSPHRRQDDQEQYYELNEGWKKDSDLIKNLRHQVAALGRIVDRKNEEIAELKRHNLALVEQIQTQHKQIDQLQTSLESLEKDKHETPPGKVMVDGVEWYRLGLKVRRLDEDFGARLKLLEDAHTSLASFIRRCVETISEAPKLGALEPRKEQGKEK